MTQRGKIETGVDDLIRLVKSNSKISLPEASKKLKIPLKTLETWVDFLVEEGELSVDYQFTTPYISLRQHNDDEDNLSIKDEDFQDEIQDSGINPSSMSSDNVSVPAVASQSSQVPKPPMPVAENSQNSMDSSSSQVPISVPDVNSQEPDENVNTANKDSQNNIEVPKPSNSTENNFNSLSDGQNTEINQLFSNVENHISNNELDNAYSEYLKICNIVSNNNYSHNSDFYHKKLIFLNEKLLNNMQKYLHGYPDLENKIKQYYQTGREYILKSDIESAKKIFHDMKSVYDSLPSLLVEQKRRLYEFLSSYYKEVIEQDRKITENSLKRLMRDVGKIKQKIEFNIDNEDIASAQQLLDEFENNYKMIPNDLVTYRVTVYNELLKAKEEIKIAKTFSQLKDSLKDIGSNLKLSSFNISYSNDNSIKEINNNDNKNSDESNHKERSELKSPVPQPSLQKPDNENSKQHIPSELYREKSHQTDVLNIPKPQIPKNNPDVEKKKDISQDLLNNIPHYDAVKNNINKPQEKSQDNIKIKKSQDEENKKKNVNSEDINIKPPTPSKNPKEPDNKVNENVNNIEENKSTFDNNQYSNNNSNNDIMSPDYNNEEYNLSKPKPPLPSSVLPSNNPPSLKENKTNGSLDNTEDKKEHSINRTDNIIPTPSVISKEKNDVFVSQTDHDTVNLSDIHKDIPPPPKPQPKENEQKEKKFDLKNIFDNLKKDSSKQKKEDQKHLQDNKELSSIPQINENLNKEINEPDIDPEEVFTPQPKDIINDSPEFESYEIDSKKIYSGDQSFNGKISGAINSRNDAFSISGQKNNQSILNDSFLLNKYSDSDPLFSNALRAYNNKEYNKARNLLVSVLKQDSENGYAKQMLEIIDALLANSNNTQEDNVSAVSNDDNIKQKSRV